MEYRLELRDGYVFVYQKGQALTVSELEGMQAAISAAMREGATRYVMFDNRDTLPPEEWIRASMWTWLCDHVGRAAMLQKEAKNIKRAERTGKRNRVPLRAFHDEEEAEAWLLSSRAS